MNPAIVPPSAPPPPLPRSMPITLFVVKYDPYPMWNPFARKPLANPPRNISPLTKDRPRSDYRQSSQDTEFVPRTLWMESLFRLNFDSKEKRPCSFTVRFEFVIICGQMLFRRCRR